MLLAICILFCVWATASYWQMQQAMRWWCRREAIDLAAQADRIQNGLIQDLFAVRLSLQSALSEVLSEAFSQPLEDRLQQQRVWVTQAEKLHEHLTDLSHALSQPYLAESLPLAIRSRLKQWQASHSQASLQLDLPQDWRAEPLERSRIILTLLETLLDVAVTAGLPHAALEIVLTDRSIESGRFQAELTVKITYPDVMTRRASTRVKELKYLRRCFCFLVPGRCSYQTQASAAVWRFHWKS